MGSDHDRVARAKAVARLEARRRRDACTDSERRQASQRIFDQCIRLAEIATARFVFIYVSTPLEVDTHALIEHCSANGQQVLVPHLLDKTRMVAVAFPGWERLHRGALGILSPPPDSVAHAGAVDAVIVPALAYTAGGTRLGYGAGYYDRWLAGHSHAATIGVSFECQVFPDLPCAATDLPVACLVTESRVVRRTMASKMS